MRYLLVFFLLISVTATGQIDYIKQATEDLTKKKTEFTKLEESYNKTLDDYNIFLDNNDVDGRLTKLQELESLKIKLEKAIQEAKNSIAYFKQNNVSQDLLKTLFPFELDLSYLKLPKPDPSQLPVQFAKDKRLISSKSFTRKIAQDFSYLILGEDSPQQGVSATLNEKGSSIKLNGILHRSSYNIFTLEADLTSTNGVYFFDQEKGGEQAKISLNYFRNLYSSSKYFGPSTNSKQILQDSILTTIEKAYSDYYNLYDLLKSVAINKPLVDQSLPFGNAEDTLQQHQVNNSLIKIVATYINNQEDKAFNRLRKLPFESKAYLSSKPNQGKTPVYNINKIRAALLRQKNYITKKLDKKLSDIELRHAEEQWTRNVIVVGGVSPFYQRETFRRFTLDPTTTFKKMFRNEKGDIFGGNAFLSYNYQLEDSYKPTSWNKLIPKQIFVRATATFARSSNFSSFRNSTLESTQQLGNDSAGNPIIFTSSDAAFIGDNTYEYGNSIAFSGEVFYYPIKIPLGLFGKISYEYINFSSDKDIKDKELAPLRVGVVYNITNKNKGKPLVVIQAFFDRTDLSLSPNGTDNDLRFGFGVGLPINIK